MNSRSPSISHASYLYLRNWHVLLDLPINIEGIIKDADTTISLRMIEVVTLALEDGNL